ncbi:MAG: molecular chaperone HtpG [Clostridia bacterium]|jgi:molecular chaperone HtpG|nr:molecular chaperone HtpG [Clostridia bacterium]MCI1999303.1 molecular chaperone HtpG [Clostridia bacterium]MCI2014744.1 molecular chaperone HtpG [Clostridia bacterium]
MAQEKGNLSINSENFLPIIKKWLYTDKDIFLRELVSNGCDAVTKLQKLVGMGEADIPTDEKFAVHVDVSKKDKTIKISDNGIGMTADEVKKYINQIAFSGASDFLAKYKDKTDEGNEIIGHFGLGFYSAFMVADKVEIDTLSYQKDAKSAKWISNGGIDYEMTDGTRTERGTTVTLFIGEDGKEFLEYGLMYNTLKKYCSFMPVEIYFSYESEEKEKEKKAETEKTETKAAETNTETANEKTETAETKEEKSSEEGKEENTEKKAEEPEKKEEPKPINETTPLWLKNAKDITDDDYKKFYHDVFHDFNDPLFWIHLNMDYPFKLKGILYFPKLTADTDVLEGEIKLYSNQVYIADNIKEVVPEFLLILKGVMDCPDLPLNVSRSALQNDGYAAKMSTYITKKVADKLNSIFKNDRTDYEKFWDDISIFIKYGCIKEEKFYDKVKDSLIYKTTNGIYKTLSQYLEDNKDKQTDKAFYVSDENQQVQYVNMLKEQGMEALILSSRIDVNFISFLEYKLQGKPKFERVDADIADTLKDSSQEADENLSTELQNLFRGILNNEKLNVKAESLKSENVSSMMLLDEHSRRMLDMMEMYKNQPELLKMFGDVKPEYTLVLNRKNSLVKKLIELKNKTEDKESTDLICNQLYDLALMTQKSLEPEEMSKFIERSNKIMEKMLEK